MNQEAYERGCALRHIVQSAARRVEAEESLVDSLKSTGYTQEWIETCIRDLRSAQDARRRYVSAKRTRARTQDEGAIVQRIRQRQAAQLKRMRQAVIDAARIAEGERQMRQIQREIDAIEAEKRAKKWWQFWL